MARATWKGSISFGLVNVPVQLFTAVRKHDVRFTQLHAGTNARVRQKRVDEETGEEVAYEDIVKGYEVGDDRFVVVEPAELEALDPDASRTIDIQDFVALAEIDPIYYDRAYHLLPDGEAARKPYRLLAEAMERAGKVAVATFVMRNRSYLAALRARDGVLVLSTMHYADEVAEPSELDGAETLEDVEVSQREVAMAEQLIASLETDFDPAAYRDEYQQRVVEFLEAKAEGTELEVRPPQREVGGVIDLVAALEQSLERARGGADAGGGGGGARGADGRYAAMTRDELYDLAQERELPGRSSMSKDELAAALADADRTAEAS